MTCVRRTPNVLTRFVRLSGAVEDIYFSGFRKSQQPPRYVAMTLCIHCSRAGQNIPCGALRRFLQIRSLDTPLRACHRNVLVPDLVEWRCSTWLWMAERARVLGIAYRKSAKQMQHRSCTYAVLLTDIIHTSRSRQAATARRSIDDAATRVYDACSCGVIQPSVSPANFKLFLAWNITKRIQSQDGKHPK